MKHVLMALAILILASACSQYPVYEENLHYMTNDTLEAEKTVATQHLQEAQTSLAKAEASGNPEKIKEARDLYKDAEAKVRAIAAEEHSRNRHW
jgi:hypothetical protein